MPLDSHNSGHKIPDGSKPPAGAPPRPAPLKAGGTDYCDCGNWSGSHCRPKYCARKPPPEQVEKVRQAIFNVLSGETEPNTGMILYAVYDALGYPGIDHPPPSTSAAL